MQSSLGAQFEAGLRRCSSVNGMLLKILRRGWPKPYIRRRTETKYIWSATEDELELERNHAKLMERIREGECEYIWKNWIPKERQVIRFWTHRFPNLDCLSTQRDESVHPTCSQELNPQTRLDGAVQRLRK
jgi:hypothetical protein